MKVRPTRVFHEYQVNEQLTVGELVELLEENFCGEDHLSHLSLRGPQLEIQVRSVGIE